MSDAQLCRSALSAEGTMRLNTTPVHTDK